MNAPLTPPARPHSTAEALALFDSLPAVDTTFMLGDWQGEGFPTGHRLDGLLEAFFWQGKRFVSTEEVHPLVFTRSDGRRYYANPALIPIRLAARLRLPRPPLAGQVFRLLRPLFGTTQPRARLRLANYRGKTSAAMQYTQIPVTDHFRQLDHDTVLGAMELAGMEPFFWVCQSNCVTWIF